MRKPSLLYDATTEKPVNRQTAHLKGGSTGMQKYALHVELHTQKTVKNCEYPHILSSASTFSLHITLESSVSKFVTTGP